MNNPDNLYPHHRSPFYLRERVSYSVPNPPIQATEQGQSHEMGRRKNGNGIIFCK